MKIPPLFFRFTVATLLAAGSALRGADTPPALAAAHENGYTVTVDIHVNEQGKAESVSLVKTNDVSTGDVLTKMAIAMAMKTVLPPHLKDGQPVKFTARAPFFFPIKDDEGAAANAAPKPKVKRENWVLPAYPPELRAQGVAGGVILEIVVDATGKLARLTTLRASNPEFATAAVEAVRKWSFAPAMKDGQPVESRTRLAIVFETEEKMADVEWRIPPRPSLGSFTVIRPDHPLPAEAPAAPPAAAPAVTSAPAASPAPPAAPATGK